VADLIHRAHADTVIVTGQNTGASVADSELAEIIAAAEGTPVIIGSGVTAETIRSYRSRAAAVIVGSAFKYDGKATNAVDPSRVEKLMGRLRG
jgi:predicted TIM-barrel enzyme